MVKQLNLKRFACMVIAILFMTVITSCTSDEFFGIEEDYDGVSFSMLEKIAHSKEYLEFQKQSILSAKEICNLDTANRVMYILMEIKHLQSMICKHGINALAAGTIYLIQNGSIPRFIFKCLALWK